jgi:hypothetical protein
LIRFFTDLNKEESTETDRFLEECISDPTLRDKLSVLSRTFTNRKRVCMNILNTQGLQSLRHLDYTPFTLEFRECSKSILISGETNYLRLERGSDVCHFVFQIKMVLVLVGDSALFPELPEQKPNIAEGNATWF